MSATMQGINAKGYLSGWLQGLEGMTTADIKAIPADKWTATFGGTTRPANELCADTVSLLDWVTGALKGNVQTEGYMEKMTALAAECANQDRAIAKFSQSVKDFNAALEAASDEDLNKEVTPPWEMPAPLFMMAQIAVSHVWYHDGQFNYIQNLLGDDKVHWMGD